MKGGIITRKAYSRFLIFRVALLTCTGISLLLILVGCSRSNEVESIPAEAVEDELAQPEVLDTEPADEKAAYEIPETTHGVLVAGHAVVLVGIDVNSRTLFVHDPGDNLVDGSGIHRWKAKPTSIPYEYSSGYLALQFSDLIGYVFDAVYLDDRSDSFKVTDQYIAGVPDFSQHAVRPGWQNMCVPSCAAGLIYFYHDTRYSELLFQKSIQYPSPNELVNVMIAGLTPDFPEHSSIAHYMNSSIDRGTLPEHVVPGLERFLEVETEIPQGLLYVNSLFKDEVKLDARTLEARLGALIKRQVPCMLLASWTPPDARDLDGVRKRTLLVEQSSGPSEGGEDSRGGSQSGPHSGTWLLDVAASLKENTSDEGLYPDASAQAKDMLTTLLDIYAGYAFEITPSSIVLHDGQKNTQVTASFEEVGTGEFTVRCNEPERFDFRSYKIKRARLYLVLRTFSREFVLVCKRK